jgi:hypothetical protein
MQISRKYLGKLDTLSKYNPLDFFDLCNDERLYKALSDLLSDSHMYGRLYVNGEEHKNVDEAVVERITHFIKESKVREVVKKYQ